MLKKAIVVGGVVLLLGVLFGRTHLRTAVGMARQAVKDNVPVQFDIKRAREMIKGLAPEIEKNMHVIAREETEVAKLEKQVSAAESLLAKDRDGILRLKKDLASGSETFVYCGRNYSAKQVKEDLTHRFDQFKTREATADNLRQILAARQASLLAAREKLEGMLAAKRTLEVDVENLEARLKMVEVRQTTSDYNFDDSELSRTKELISEIADRIDVAEKLVNAGTGYQDQIPLDEAAEDRDIADEVAKYFSEKPAAGQAEALVQGTP